MTGDNGVFGGSDLVEHDALVTGGFPATENDAINPDDDVVDSAL